MKTLKAIAGGIAITSISAAATASDIESRVQDQSRASATTENQSSVQSELPQNSYNFTEANQNDGSLLNTVQQLMSELFQRGGSNEPLC